MIVAMEYKDYYQILGLSRGASADEIRTAYRKLAKQYHPDMNPGDKKSEERFKEVNEAYQVLSDPQKRARYDQLGSAYSDWQRGGGAPGGFNWDEWFTGGSGGATVNGQQVDLNDLFGAGGFSDFFSAIFGGMGGSASARPGTDFRQRRAPAAAEQPVTISLDEAYHGAIRAYEIQGKRVQIRIPAGSKTGTKVRVPASATGVGDVYLKVTVADDPRFERDGDDLRAPVQVDLFTALLGGEAEVQTMTGKVRLTIPPGTQPDQLIRLAGRGMPVLKDPEKKGDLFVRVKVRLPRRLSEEQKKLLAQVRALQKDE